MSLHVEEPHSFIGVTDSFCGAGGSSTALTRACAALGIEFQLLAMNHWEVAIATHTANHPKAEHRLVNLETAKVADTRAKWPVDVAWFSPSCPEHSYAKGGASIDEQKRAHPWIVTRMVGDELPRVVIVENVVNIRSWGPCETLPDGRRRPIKSRRGETFRAWWKSIESLGYVGRDAILNAKDFGAPQDRARWFAIFRRDGLPVEFPVATHGPPDSLEVAAGHKLPYVPASEIIDFSLQAESIVRRIPLAAPTLARVFYGARSLWGDATASLFAPRFLIAARQGLAYQRRRLPLLRERLAAASTAKQVEDRTKSVKRCEKAIPRYRALVEELERFLAVPREISSADLVPIVIALRGTSPDALRRTSSSAEAPTPAVLADGNHLGVAVATARPFVGANRTNNVAKDVAEPGPPATTAHGGGLYLAEPCAMVLGQQGNSTARSVAEPTQALAARGYLRLIKPVIVDVRGGSRPKRARDPQVDQLGGVTTHNGAGIAEAFVAAYYGDSAGRTHHRARSQNKPLPAIPTENRLALVQPSAYIVSHGSLKEGQDHVSRCRSVESQTPAATASGAGYLAQVEVIPDDCSSEGTIVEIDGVPHLMDIGFRMFEPPELQLAQGFGRDYVFTGSTHDVTAQIGNAVEVLTGEAIYTTVLRSIVSDRDGREAVA